MKTKVHFLRVIFLYLLNSSNNMVKNDQDFVDPLDYMSEEDLQVLEEIAELSAKDIRKLPNKEKLDKVINWVISVGTEEELVQLIKEMLKVMTGIEYNDFKEIQDLSDELYWETNYTEYNEGWGVRGKYNENTQLGQLFKEGKKDYYVVNGEKVYIDRTPITKTAKVVKRSYYNSKPDFLDLSETSYPLKLKYTLSPLATAKLFLMMKFYQGSEWGAYMKLDKALPKLEDLYQEGEWDIEVLDFILIPQVRSSAHVEYLENELPEFMDDWRKAKLDKFYVNSGRIHSHHTMGTWHSGTDTGEFEKAFETEDRLFSIVVAFEDKIKKIDLNKDLDDWDYFFKALSFDCVLFIPLVGDQKNQVKCEYGYQIRNSIYLNHFGVDEIKEAVKWRESFEEMDVFVNQKYPLINKLLQLQSAKKIDEVDFYHIRSQIFKNENMFSFVEDLIEVISETSNKINSNLRFKNRMDEIKKIVDRT